jgi:DNA-binding transcriptional regulator YhcF (GntR family)
VPRVTIHPLDPGSADPPFEQLRRQVASRAASGDLAAGTRLPTVRALAEQLGVAAGTVARAYKELEADGVLVTEGRRGTFVRSSGAATSGDARAAATTYAAEARRLGLGLDEATRLLEEAWRR